LRSLGRPAISRRLMFRCCMSGGRIRRTGEN